MTGTVRWFNTEKGYGFISTSDGRDVFAHQTAIQMVGFRKLVQGETVEFDLDESDPRGPKAANVKRLEVEPATGQKIGCDSP